MTGGDRPALTGAAKELVDVGPPASFSGLVDDAAYAAAVVLGTDEAAGREAPDAETATGAELVGPKVAPHPSH